MASTANAFGLLLEDGDVQPSTGKKRNKKKKAKAPAAQSADGEYFARLSRAISRVIQVPLVGRNCTTAIQLADASVKSRVSTLDYTHYVALGARSLARGSSSAFPIIEQRAVR